jgi:hypothetical protein
MGGGANILFGTIAPGGGSGPVFEGARNGNSVDAGGFVVLGQDVSEAGDPAALLNNREVPMTGGFRVNWFGGCTLLSTVQGATPAAQLLEIQGIMESAVSVVFMNVAVDSTLAGSSPTMIELNATAPAPVGIGTQGAYLVANINGVQSFFMAYDGQTFWKNPLTGVAYFTISDAVELIGAVGQATLQIEPIYNTSIPGGVFTDIFLHPSFTSAFGAAGVTQMILAPTIDQTGGTGQIIGVSFDPVITAITGQLIAWQNTVGDVLLQLSGTTGRTGIRGIATPTAHLHIGGGVAAAGGAPLKIAPGTLLTVPEDGAIEYDGTNFYKTIGATRTVIL